MPAEERFDAITRLARAQFDVPLACLDIVGDKLVWLKSVQGFDGFVGLRKDSYCHYTVLSEGVCLIRDARRDPRVHDSILVHDWVFYAGVPLHFQGRRVGVLCIGDGKEREFTASQFNQLMSLAALAEKELQASLLSPAQAALAEGEDELELQDRVDLITRVWNRSAILKLAGAECAGAAGKSPVAALMIGIDDLPRIRRDLGRPMGDQVMRVAAGRLRAALPPTDPLGLYEDGVFLALLPNAGPREAALLCEKIRAAIAAAPVQSEKTVLPVSCRVGWAGLSDAGAGDLLARARQALQRAGA
jgi:diguanylate cyclase (GGDEF)-like protein